MEEVAGLPRHAGMSNWYDPFKDVTDLKPVVLRRLFDHFPDRQALLALRPERFVRVVFEVNYPVGRGISGYVRNLGRDVALRLRMGLSAEGREVKIGTLPGLTVQETYPDPGTDKMGILFQYPLSENLPDKTVLYCEYQNVYGDRFRLEVPLKREAAGSGHQYSQHFEDELYVRPAGSNAEAWLRVH
jgi:hypothetical protein